MSTAQADILLKIAADISELRNAVAESKNASSSFLDLAKSGAALTLGFQGVEGVLSGIKDALKDSITVGVQYNSTIETMRVSFAGMLRNFGGNQFKDFNSALAAGGDLMAKIRARANELGISFEGLADTYKTTAGVLFASGITNAQKQLDLVVTLQKAMQALGVTGFQATRDIQDILTGQSARTKAGRELGISDQDILAAREAGTLYEFLTQKLSGFNEAASASADTLQAVETRLHNIVEAQFGNATQELTQSYKDLLKAVTELVQSDGFKQLAGLIGSAATGAVKATKDVLDAVQAAGSVVSGKAKDSSKLDSASLKLQGSVGTLSPELFLAIQTFTEAAKGLGFIKRDIDNTPGNKQRSEEKAEDDSELSRKRGGQAVIASGQADDAAEVQAQEARQKIAEEAASKYLTSKADEYEKVLNASKLVGESDEDRLKTLDQQIAVIQDQAAAQIMAAQSGKEAEAENVKVTLQLAPLLKEREATEKRITAEKEKQIETAYKDQAAADKAQETAIARGEIERARVALAASEVERRAIEENQFLTSDEKKAALAVAIQKENDLIDANIKKLKERQAVTNDVGAKQSIEGTVNTLDQKKATNNADLGGKDKILGLGDQLAVQFAKMKDGFTTVAQAITSVVGSAISGISGSIVGLINRTMTWRQALVNIGSTIAQSVVKSFADMAAQWIVQLSVMDRVNALFRKRDIAQEAATTSAKVGIHASGEAAKTGATASGSFSRGLIVLGETIYHALHVALRVTGHVLGELAKTTATALGTSLRIPMIIAESLASVIHGAVEAFSAMASIPYVGPFLGAAAMAAALVAGYSLVKGISKGFASGGYTGDGGTFDLAGQVHKGEVVFSQRDVARAGGVNRVEQMRMSGGASVNAMRMGSGAIGQSAVKKPAQSSSGLNMAFFNTKQDASDWLRSQKGRGQMLDFLQQHRA